MGTKRNLAGELALYRDLLETAPDAFVVVDRRGCIRLVNAQTERLFGYSRDELIGGPVERLLPERLDDRHRSQRETFFAAPRTRPMAAGIDLVGRRRDGVELPLEINLSPLEVDGDLLVSAAIRDVSQRRALEQALRDASRLKSEFLVSMSHELRTPMTTILGFTELMHQGGAGPLAPEQREYLGDVLNSARHLLQLINDVLDLAKIEAGKIELRAEPVDLEPLAGEVCDTLRGLAAGKRLSMVSFVAAELGAVVADPARIKQVLYNYLSNAIKFTPEGGTITLRVTAEESNRFRLAVSDTGVGIAENDVARLFADYQQVGAWGDGRRQGTGLGLALTKRIVEAHGGRVEVTSIQGVGSTFSAVLPRVMPAAGRPPE